MDLSHEQKLVFDKYISGQNIFITGPGGTGKSEIIRNIYKDAYSKNKNIQVTALTGCAAVLLNCSAKTIHSWAGIGLGTSESSKLIDKIRKNQFYKKVWKQIQILVIDEVSMMSVKLFDHLNKIGKAMRHSSRPFGGIQVIFAGDFYQLPPVGNKEDPDTQNFCFESPEWNTCFPLENQITLKKIFRQKDNEYCQILNQIRQGKVKAKTIGILSTYVGRTAESSLVITPTKLYPTRSKVDAINNEFMSKLDAPEKRFKISQRKDLEMSKAEKESRSIINQKEIDFELDFISNNLLCDKELILKEGAQVMCIINLTPPTGNTIEICNGSQGIVTGFCDITGCPRVKFNNGLEQVMTKYTWCSDRIPGIGVAQVPLILAWALTIHKSQGASLDAAEIDVGSGIFECGQTYVALSRVKSLDGLYLKSFDLSKIKINKKVKDFYDSNLTQGIQDKSIKKYFV